MSEPTGASTLPTPSRAGLTPGRGQRLPARAAPAAAEVVASSPRIAAVEVLIACLGALALAVLTSWPLVLHLGSRISPDLGDPIRTAWQVAEEGHALLSHPLSFFQTNAFWPHPNSLTFSDVLLGYSPAGLIGSGARAALVRYNLLYLFAWTLPAIGAYLLGRELGLRRGAAAVVAAGYTYAPFKAAEAGHLHVISNGAIPLALFLLVRGYRRGSAGLVVAGWLVATWQLSLGFTLGLPFSYTLMVIAVVVAVSWWRRGAHRVPRPLVVATVAGAAVYLAMGLFIARPYLKTSHDYPTATRAISEIRRYSAGPRAFIAAPLENRVWGGITRPIRYRLSSQNESVLFPGAVTLLLALTGLASGAFPRRLRAGLLAGTVVFALLALGLDLLPGGYPYKLLYDYLPGWNGVRVPGRMYSMTALGLALLAGAGAQALVRPRWPRGLATGLAVLLCAAIVYEGAGREKHPVVPPAPAGVADLPAPQLWLPTEDSTDRLYQLWSTNGFPAIANGVSTFDIPAHDDLRGGMQNFPDAAGVRKLQQLGIRTVILAPQVTHAGLPPDNFAVLEPPNPEQAAVKSIAGLPVLRRVDGQVVIFTIERPRP